MRVIDMQLFRQLGKTNNFGEISFLKKFVRTNGISQ